MDGYTREQGAVFSPAEERRAKLGHDPRARNRAGQIMNTTLAGSRTACMSTLAYRYTRLKPRATFADTLTSRMARRNAERLQLTGKWIE